MMKAETSSLLERVINDAFEGKPVKSEEEIGFLFNIPLFSPESAGLIAAARRLSEIACDGKAEVHAQIAVNIGPCKRRCRFCSFSEEHGIFKEAQEFPIDYLVESCLQFESDGANAIFLMATGMYPFKNFLDKGIVIRGKLKPETVLIANVGDFDEVQAGQLREAGFDGIYHAVRLGEGKDTAIPIERRLKTLHIAKEIGLSVGTCLEPVGPEHTTGELIEKLLITRDCEPAYSGSARRIPIPGTELAGKGVVSEAAMAHILAVVRMVLPLSIKGNCTHEPNSLGAAAGANLLWAEVGANPRDTRERTEESRGLSVPRCREVLEEAEWNYLEGPSVFYRATAH